MNKKFIKINALLDIIRSWRREPAMYRITERGIDTTARSSAGLMINI
jgi:hypothetical protein